MQTIVGLLGAKGAGKDTAASLLVQKLGFRRVSFADALYLEAATAYSVTVEFLSRRETKETPLAELTLKRCQDPHFVEVMVQLALSAGHSLTEALSLPRSPRWTLQMWGTEYRRRSSYGTDSYWLDQVAYQIEACPAQSFVITDVRFPNEADYVEGAGGLLIRVRRPTLEAQEDLARKNGTATALHPSETELLSRPVRHELINREGYPRSLAEGLSVAFPQLLDAA